MTCNPFWLLYPSIKHEHSKYYYQKKEKKSIHYECFMNDSYSTEILWNDEKPETEAAKVIGKSSPSSSAISERIETTI